MALLLGIPPSTLYDELDRGCTTPPKRNGSLPERFPSYSAVKAQELCNQRKGDHGPKSKMTTTVSQLLTHYIREMRMSPETAVYHLKKEHDISLCHKTVYNYIHSGLLAVTDDDLLRGRQPQRKRRIKPVVAKTCKEGHLVDDIPNHKEWKLRGEFGHWEMDTVHSASGKLGGLLVLIERKTRFYLCAKLPRLTQSYVHRALRKLLKSGRIIEMKSLLTDNGCEFAAHLEITRLLSIKGRSKVTVFFADSYCSWQKGAIENANKLIRKYIPKKSNFDDFSDSKIMRIQKKLNARPREKLNFDSPKNCFFNHFY